MEPNDLNRELTAAAAATAAAEVAIPPATADSSAPPPKKKAKKKPATAAAAAINTDSAAAIAAASAALTAALESNASPLTSSRASNSGASVPKNLAPRVNQILSKREALKRDKAWLSTSPADHLPAVLASHYASSSSMTRVGLLTEEQRERTEENMPWLFREEVKIIQQALLANGLSTQDNVSLEALGCLLEQARRYALEILADAHEFALHRKQQSKFSLQTITPADIALALDFRADADVASTLPSLQVLVEDVNRKPLPPIPSHCYNGVVLPDRDHQLTAMTFDVVSSKRVKDRMTLGGKPMSALTVQGVVENIDSRRTDGGTHDNTTHGTTNENNTKRRKTASMSSYGASKGKPIPVNLKSPFHTNPFMDAAISSSLSNVPPAVVPTIPSTTTTTTSMSTAQTIPQDSIPSIPSTMDESI
jgi:histone H3/H4